MVLFPDDKCVTHNGLSLIDVVVTLGIAFGDIGTSPLYVMKAIVTAGSAINAQYITGAVSCIIWTLTLQATVKHMLIALRTDNRGEDGILAFYALIRRHSPKWFYLLAIIGASTLVADGAITPSITMLSAIEGLKVYEPSTPTVPICLCIITVLFAIQQFGTNATGRFFGPLMFVWFAMMGALDIGYIVDFLPILKALNPYYVIELLVHDPKWFLTLGAVLLCTAGAETLYSDLGHCGAQSIRVSWAFVKLILILNYLGQGAWIIGHPDSLVPGINPFYTIMPHNFLFFGIVMATIAAVIVSQALISGSFTIFSEVMNLKFWPRQKIKYTTGVKGQLYVPFVNMALYVLCALVILFFQNSENMEATCGLAITITMFMTTFLLSAYLHRCRVSPLFILPFVVFLVGVEGIFFIANMFKFVHGGWVTMLMAGVMFSVMYVWYSACLIRGQQVNVHDVRNWYDVISDIKKDISITEFTTSMVYLSKPSGTYEIKQKILYSIISKYSVQADHYILLHINYQGESSTLEYEFTTLIPDMLYRINLNLGFRIQPLVNLYFRQIIRELVARKEFIIDSSHPSLRKHHTPANFTFVIINQIYAALNHFSQKERIIVGLYSLISHIKLSMTHTLGLDTSNVFIENVPLVVKPHHQRAIRRIDNNADAG